MTAVTLSTTIDKCRICDSSAIESVLDLGRQPLANDLRAGATVVQEAFPLEICRCNNCGTVQLTETINPEALFQEYVWVTGTSAAAREYAKVFHDRLIARCEGDPQFIVEVASNDGTFLKPFAADGRRVLGVDPARNIAALAEENGVPTRAEFFGLDVARRVVADHGPADAVFARNVIPHVANATDVIAGIAFCLSENGTGAIEFHRADIILEELHYDSIYHEHLYFHSIDSLTRLLAKFGLIPFDVTESPISGGSHVVYFSKMRRPATKTLAAAVAREESLGIGRAEGWNNFARRCQRHRELLRQLVLGLKAQGKRIIAYGASARSSTLLNYCGIDASVVDVVVDRAPLKHGKVTPGTNIPIVPPADGFARRPDVVLLLGWNFRDEILSQIRAEQHWTGEVIVPLPGDPTVVTLT